MLDIATSVASSALKHARRAAFSASRALGLHFILGALLREKEGGVGLFVLHWIAWFSRWNVCPETPDGVAHMLGEPFPLFSDVPALRVLLVGEETALFDSILMYHHARLLAWEKNVPLCRIFVLCKKELEPYLFWVPGLVFVDRANSSGVVRKIVQETKFEDNPCIVGIFPAGKRAFVPLSEWRTGAAIIAKESSLCTLPLAIDWGVRRSQLAATLVPLDRTEDATLLYDRVASVLGPYRPAVRASTPLAPPSRGAYAWGPEVETRAQKAFPMWAGAAGAWFLGKLFANTVCALC
jgi:hypothetical protein